MAGWEIRNFMYELHYVDQRLISMPLPVLRSAEPPGEEGGGKRRRLLRLDQGLEKVTHRRDDWYLVRKDKEAILEVGRNKSSFAEF